MVNAEFGAVLQHIRRLASAPAPDDPSDGALLERFAQRGEQGAFAALVRRHGPMVLDVCRRVLRDGHGADDAFQATFLVLLRRARALARTGCIAGWLYTVAYHVALRARADTARRRKHERESSAVPRREPGAGNEWLDLKPVLDEELNRLPDKYRAAVVLCYLQGKTNEEAARLLGWPSGTMKGRLHRARALLRVRLARRGVALSAGLGAGVAVPAALARAAVRVATAGAAPAASALAEGVLRASFVGKMKVAVPTLLVLGMIVLGVGALGPQPQAERAAPPTAVVATPGVSAEPPPPAKAAGDKDDFAVAGRVLDADGKPVAGAKVAAIGLIDRPYRGRIGFREHETLATAEADREGRFRLTCPAAAGRAEWPQVLASAPGHGLGWRRLRRDDRDDLTIQLRPEQVIRGRLIDLQGQPAKGVRLHVTKVKAPDGEVPFFYGLEKLPARLDVWPGAVTTDEDGRFTVRGLGKDLAVTLLARDEHFARQSLVVSTTAKGKPEMFEHALEPARLLEGRVVGEDTGQPIGKKVLLEIGTGGDLIQVWADEKGRFTARCAPGHVLIEPYPPDGSPYLTRFKSFDWPKGKVKHEVEVALPRGVLVRGTVAEADSDKPVAGAVVSYFVREDNPFTSWTIMSWKRFPGECVRTKTDGTFEATVYPGPGTLLAKGPTRDYVLQRLDTKELALGKPGGAALYAEGVAPLDLKAGAGAKEVTLKLQRGATIKGRVLDPGGKPVPSAVLYYHLGLQDNGECAWFHHYASVPVAVKDGYFSLTGLDPKGEAVVHVLDPKNEVGARVVLSGKSAGEEVIVTLRPCGKVKARFVDEDGKPFPGHSLGLQLLLDAATYAAVSQNEVLGGAGPFSDAEGRLTLGGLIPGATYRYYDGKKSQEFTAESGKAREFPDVVYPRPKEPRKE